jgi:hypothetical protein
MVPVTPLLHDEQVARIARRDLSSSRLRAICRNGDRESNG